MADTTFASVAAAASKTTVVPDDALDVLDSVALDSISDDAGAVADKYKNGKCHRCPGYIMMNSRTGKPFVSCFKCSTRCPTKDCNGFRGKSEKGYRYSHCAKCSFKDNYKSRESLGKKIRPEESPHEDSSNVD